MATIKIAIRLEEYSDILSLIQVLQPCHQAQSDDLVQFELDLRCESDFIYTEKLLVLACIISDLRSRGVQVLGFINANWDGNAAKYASRINFFKHIDLKLSESFKRHENNGRFVEITPYDKDSIYQTHIQLNSVLSRHNWIHPDVLRLLYYCMYEVLDNVLNHSAMLHGWVCAQLFRRSDEIRIVIADTGRGMHQALTSNPKYADVNEGEALLLCIQRGITAGNGLGFGLFATSEFIRRNQGDLLIYSGNHFLHHSEHETLVEQGQIWRGTLVYLRICTNVPVDYNQIMPPGHTLPDDYQEFLDKYIGPHNELW